MPRDFKKQPNKKRPQTLTGIIRVTAGAFGFIDADPRTCPPGAETKPAFTESFGGARRRDAQKESVFFPPGALATALDGDEVEYQKTRGDNGEVIKILKRARTEFVGNIVEVLPDFLVVKPDNPKFYTEIVVEVPASDLPKKNTFVPETKVLVRLGPWPKDTLRPSGKLLKVLGATGTHETEMQAIILNRGLIDKFPPELEEEAVRIAKEHQGELASDKPLADRRDFSAITTFTIDPVNAKDFDDALSIREMEKGFWEIGVHIADVSHYVKPNTLLDQEAQKRTTSVYLVDRTIPMLPEVLSNNLCSLVPNEKRLTFSAVFVMDEKANIKSEWFGRTAIKSDYRFTYEEAHQIIENKQGKFCHELMTLNSLAKELDRQKISAGALAFEEDEVKFEIDAEGRPLDIYKQERLTTHKLVEDFMLLANKKVAEYVSRLVKNRDNSFVYRIHDAPDPEKLEGVKRFIGLFGHKLQTKGHKPNPLEINNFLKKLAGAPEESVITREIIRSMSRAIYGMKNIGHFGLAFANYTHFTSPIRRYPDIMVHRLLDTYLQKKIPLPETLQEYDKLCARSSDMEKLAADAERESIKYKQAEYLENHLGEIFDGVISGLTKWGMYVEELSTGSEGLIRYRNMTDDRFTFNEKKFLVSGEKSGKSYRLGDTVKIKVIKTDRTTKTIDFALSAN